MATPEIESAIESQHDIFAIHGEAMQKIAEILQDEGIPELLPPGFDERHPHTNPKYTELNDKLGLVIAESIRQAYEKGAKISG